MHEIQLISFSQTHEYSSGFLFHHCQVQLEYATAQVQRGSFVVHPECQISRNSTELIIKIKQNTYLRAFHRCYPINYHNTSKRQDHPHCSWRLGCFAIFCSSQDTLCFSLSSLPMLSKNITTNSPLSRPAAEGSSHILKMQEMGLET